jgi:uncharacterized protein YegP (UPF0339 family)
MYWTVEPRSGGFRALAYGGNNEKLFWSEIYTRKASALHAISVVNSAYNAPVYDRT